MRREPHPLFVFSAHEKYLVLRRPTSQQSSQLSDLPVGCLRQRYNSLDANWSMDERLDLSGHLIFKGSALHSAPLRRFELSSPLTPGAGECP